MNLLEKLQTTYDESCFPVHDTLSMEPEYECEYCGHKDVAPAHGDDCSAVDAVMAKHEIERLSKEINRLQALAWKYGMDYGDNLELQGVNSRLGTQNIG